MPTFRSAAATILLGMGLAVGLTACTLPSNLTGVTGASSAPPSGAARAAASPSAPATSTSTSTSPTAGPADLRDLPDSCPSPELVSSDLGVTVGYPAVTPDTTTFSCVFTATDNTVISLNFSIGQAVTADEAKAQLTAKGTTPAFQSVAGLGEAAFFDKASGGSYLAIFFGRVSFQVVTSVPFPVATVTTLARDTLTGYAP